MPIFNNSKNIKNIRHNNKEIVAVYANNKLVFGNAAPAVQSEYNYFTFEIPLSGQTIEFATSTGTHLTGWDGLTDWGDGTVDNKLMHQYEKAGTYTVKTKYLLQADPIGFGANAKHYLQKCSIGCTNRLNSLFADCPNVTEIDLRPLETNSILSFRNMSIMCSECTSLTSIYLPTNITVRGNLSKAFYNCSNLQSLDLTGINFTGINDTSSMFSGCSSLTSIQGLNLMDTSKVTSMEEMFQYCSSFSSLDLTGWDVSKVRNMSRMFYDCSSLVSISGLQNWSLDSLEEADLLFYECYSLTSLDLSYWSFGYVGISIQGLFNYCRSLISLNLTGWDLSNISSESTAYSGLFYDCNSLAYDQIITTGCNQKTVKIIHDSYYFYD